MKHRKYTYQTRNILLPALLIAGALVGCDSSIGDLKSNKPASNIETTESNGIITGTITAPNTSDQFMVASASSSVAESSINFPPGALAVTTTISMGPAVDQSATIISEAGSGALLAKAGNPLFIAPPSGSTPNLQSPLTLNMPLPLSDVKLSLNAATGKLVFIYAISTADGWKSGVKPLTAENLLGTFLNIEVKGLGYFQIAYLATAVAENEATSSVRPELKTTSSTEDPATPTDHPFACYKPAQKVCQRFGTGNSGDIAPKISHCQENSGQVLSVCPTANFISSCYYASNDLKYYFYTGHDNASETNCTNMDGEYSDTYSEDATL